MTFFRPPTQEQISAKAEQLWQECGSEQNDPLTDIFWTIAERMLQYANPAYPYKGHTMKEQAIMYALIIPVVFLFWLFFGRGHS